MIHAQSARRVIACGGVAALTVLMAACGSDTLGPADASPQETASGNATNIPEVKADPALAAMVPEPIRQSGTIQVGTDGSYPPNEFIGADGKTMQGFAVELFRAVAAKLGVQATFSNAAFDGIVLGVSSGKWNAGVSSLSINAERKKAVTMVQYFRAGTAWAAPRGNPRNVNPASPCGLAVAVQRGTVQVDDIEARSKACAAAGKAAIRILTEQEQTKVTADVVSGKADAMLADSPVAAYAIAQTGDSLEQIGDIYDAAPYGFVVPRSETRFAEAISQALAQLKSEGTYDAILDKWSNRGGSVSTFPVNP